MYIPTAQHLSILDNAGEITLAHFTMGWSIHCAVAYRKKLQSVFKKFFAPLARASKFVLCAVANSNKRPLTELCGLQAIKIIIANSCIVAL